MPIISIYECATCKKTFRMECKSEYIKHLRGHVAERLKDKTRRSIEIEMRDQFPKESLSESIKRIFKCQSIFEIYIRYVSLKPIKEIIDIDGKFKASIPDFSEVTGLYEHTQYFDTIYFIRKGMVLPNKFRVIDTSSGIQGNSKGRFVPGFPDNGYLYIALGDANVPVAVRFKNPSAKTLATMKIYG